MVQFHIQGRNRRSTGISEQRGQRQVLRQKFFFGILILLVGATTITKLIYSQVANKRPSPNSNVFANVPNKPSMELESADLNLDPPANSKLIPDDDKYIDMKVDVSDFDDVDAKPGGDWNSDSGRNTKSPTMEGGQMQTEKTILPKLTSEANQTQLTQEITEHGDGSTGQFLDSENTTTEDNVTQKNSTSNHEQLSSSTPNTFTGQPSSGLNIFILKSESAPVTVTHTTSTSDTTYKILPRISEK